MDPGPTFRGGEAKAVLNGAAADGREDRAGHAIAAADPPGMEPDQILSLQLDEPSHHLAPKTLGLLVWAADLAQSLP